MYTSPTLRRIGLNDEAKRRWLQHIRGGWFAIKLGLLLMGLFALMIWINGGHPIEMVKAHFNPRLQAPTIIVLRVAPPYDSTKPWTQYFSAERVWSTSNGDILLCPYPATPHGVKNCYEGDADPGLTGQVSGWVYLRTYELVDYELGEVLVGETPMGASATLKWVPKKTK